MQINRETFEAWLLAQPAEREFVYSQGFPKDEPGCLVCNFLRENTKVKNFTVYGRYVDVEGKALGFEKWLDDFLFLQARGGVRPLTFGEAQADYLKLFPDTLVVSKLDAKASHSLAPETGNLGQLAKAS